MKRIVMLAILCCGLSACLVMKAGVPTQVDVDTLRTYDMEEAIVVTSPKETAHFRNQPISASVFGKKKLQQLGVEEVKDLTAFAPNVFLPDYGSRLTSAVYIRGIGSRINTPAVGLYVDNVPYVDKSAYDFSFLDVERVDVLRGPQGTLYGRNAMGGLIRVFTADPFKYKGTDVDLSATGRTSGRSVKAVTYIHPSEKMALSLGGFYYGENGYFRNTTTGEKADGSNAAGGKLRWGFKPSSQWRIDLTASYEYSNEEACPYFLTKTDSVIAQPEYLGEISQNRQSRYRRELLNTGLGVEWRLPNFTLSSISAFQYLQDRLFMDQDFVAQDVFTLEQRQRMATFTEEISLKSRLGASWQWTTGAFFMYQNARTTCPVTFYDNGIEFLNNQFASVLPQKPAMSLCLTSPTLPFAASLSTPALNAALFHQRTFNLGRGISLTAGLRLDYDHTNLDLNSWTTTPVHYKFSMPAFRIDADLSSSPELADKLKDNTWQILPKLALQYNHASGRGNVYLAFSKGYRSGGYNIQNYSDLSQTALRRSMMMGVREYSIATIEAMPMPEQQKEMAIKGLTGTLDKQIPETPDVSMLAYKPEQSWNVELGGHLNFFDRKLHADYTFFCILTRDQQLARFADSGLGRVMVNAGKSRSCGAEISLRASLLSNRLQFSAAYGFTNAVFTDYDLGKKDGAQVDYSGNHVPFAPSHTIGVMTDFRQPINGTLLKAVGVLLNLSGAGNVYWDEANTYSQPFYATLGMQFKMEFANNVNVALWGRNLTDANYSAFSFESMGSRFAQRGHPRCFGVDVSFHL